MEKKFYVRFLGQEYFKGLLAFENMADLLQALDLMKVELEAGHTLGFVIYEGDRRIFSGGFKKPPEGGISLSFEMV